jgi:hypothetical protein
LCPYNPCGQSKNASRWSCKLQKHQL